MNSEIILVLVILGTGIILFITEIIRMDLTALVVLVALYIVGLIDPSEALSGFSNPAVIAIGSMYVLSAGLTRTGVSSIIGKQVFKLAGSSEWRLVLVLMTVTAILSSFMNNVAIAALFLPITIEIARRTKSSPSRLLLPMAYGSLLGGLVLLIGTASNLVVRDVMKEAGYSPFQIFDFAPGGLVILLICVVYMTLIGRRFLPRRKTPQMEFAYGSNGEEVDHTQYRLKERLAMLKLSNNNPLIGMTLAESRIGRALGINVLSVLRENGEREAADPNTILETGDQLAVLGRLDRIEQIHKNPIFTILSNGYSLDELLSEKIGMATFQVNAESAFNNKTLIDLAFRQKYMVEVLAIRQGDKVRQANLQDVLISNEDWLIVFGAMELIDQFGEQPGFHRLTVPEAAKYRLEERLLTIRIPENSSLVGRSLIESRLGASYGLEVLMISHDSDVFKVAAPDLKLEENDLLIISGRPLDIDVLKGLQALEVDIQSDIDWTEFVSDEVQISEVMLSPYSGLDGKTLSELHFREKYDVSVLAVWRGDRSYRSNLNRFPIKHGDAMLCYGDKQKLMNLSRSRDFVVLNLDFQEEPRLIRAPISSLIMLGVILTAIFLGAPISLAALAGCVLMVLTGALSMDEAYNGIDWRALFVIAALMPLGIAMQKTGAAAFLGDLVANSLGSFGIPVILAGLMLLTTVFTQFMPNAAVAVIMTPIALTVAQGLGIAPQAFVMAIAYALAASFLSPVAHPANLMVMSPGGYRFTDYIRHGLPIMAIVIVVSVLLLPVIFPY